MTGGFTGMGIVMLGRKMGGIIRLQVSSSAFPPRHFPCLTFSCSVISPWFLVWREEEEEEEEEEEMI